MLRMRPTSGSRRHAAHRNSPCARSRRDGATVRWCPRPSCAARQSLRQITTGWSDCSAALLVNSTRSWGYLHYPSEKYNKRKQVQMTGSSRSETLRRVWSTPWFGTRSAPGRIQCTLCASPAWRLGTETGTAWPREMITRSETSCSRSSEPCILPF